MWHNVQTVIVRHLDLNNINRLFLLILSVFLVMTAVFVFRWGMGSTIAETANNIELARLAQRWSPHDAQTFVAEGQLWLNSRVPGDEKNVVEAFERAVSLSPHDYRLWMSLGLARERAEDAAGGEKALRQAIVLAPFYARPRWALGNLLLRQGRPDEAFAELRIAGDSMEVLRPQIISIAFSTYRDVGETNKALGESVAMKAGFAKYLAQQNRLDDALKIWNSLSAEDRRKENSTGVDLFIACMKETRLRAAWEIKQGLEGEEYPKGAIGEILNPSFESDILPTGKSYFGWQIANGTQPVIAIDASRGQDGNRSLFMNFISAGGFEFRSFSQLVNVEPASRYSLEFSYKTMDLKAVGAVKIEVVDASNNFNLIASSKPIPDGTTDWQSQKFEFTTQEKTEAVIIRLARDRCSDDNCPIYGKIWYDNFSLRRINN